MGDSFYFILSYRVCCNTRNRYFIIHMHKDVTLISDILVVCIICKIGRYKEVHGGGRFWTVFVCIVLVFMLSMRKSLGLVIIQVFS